MIDGLTVRQCLPELLGDHHGNTELDKSHLRAQFLALLSLLIQVLAVGLWNKYVHLLKLSILFQIGFRTCLSALKGIYS